MAKKSNEAPEAEELLVSMKVKGLGDFEITVLIQGKDLYLPVNTIFDCLKIKNDHSASYDSLSGFVFNDKDLYLIDGVNNKVYYQDKVTELHEGDLVNSENNLYLNIKYFKLIFGLQAIFDFRRLLINLTSASELPIMKQMKQDAMRQNINLLKGELKADTTLKISAPLFNLGVADWNAMTTHQNGINNETRLGLGLGGIIAGCDASASLNYYSDQAITLNQQIFQWHYINNDNLLVKQLNAGIISTQATSTLYGPVAGIQITNTPTIGRRSYGTYTLSNITEPGWTVELYINDVLVDYQKADAMGFYSFEVPLVYGNSSVKLRFYGNYGEEKTTTQFFTIPFNFLPVHNLEYSIGAGYVEDSMGSRFSKARFNYGLTNHITIGGGYEYLSSVKSGPDMPFLNTSVRLGRNLLLSGEYTEGVRSQENLSYRFPANVQVDLNYINYDKGQTAINFNYLEERKAMITIPFNSLGATLFSRFSLDQIVLPNIETTNTTWTLSGNIHKVGLNLSTYGIINTNNNPAFYSTFSAAMQLPKKFIFTIQTQYNYANRGPDFVKCIVEKYICEKGYVNFSCQDYCSNNSFNFLLGFRYDFSGARVSFSSLMGGNSLNLAEAASGSLVFDRNTGYVDANTRSNMGKGAIVIEPFLDLNCNGKRDPGEPRVVGMKVLVTGGRVKYDGHDSVIRIFDLQPYINQIIRLDCTNFDNVAWQIKNKIIKIAVNPDMVTKMEVPVSVLGEVSGTVFMKDSTGIRPQKQMTVKLYNEYSEKVAEILTESDGYFSYFGLAPGNYTAMIDTNQLRRMHWNALPLFFRIKILSTNDGDVADGLELQIKPIPLGKYPVNNLSLYIDSITIARQGKIADSLPLIIQENWWVKETDTVFQSKKDIIQARSQFFIKEAMPVVGLPFYKDSPLIERLQLANVSKFIISVKTICHKEREKTDSAISKLSVVKKKDSVSSISGIELKHENKEIAFRDLALQVSKMFPGTVVCVVDDTLNILDISPVNAKGEFKLYDYLTFKMSLPDIHSGIIYQNVFLNEKLNVIETINTRLIKGRKVGATENQWNEEIKIMPVK